MRSQLNAAFLLRYRFPKTVPDLHKYTPIHAETRRNPRFAAVCWRLSGLASDFMPFDLHF
jgi:hypothetical protein